MRPVQTGTGPLAKLTEIYRAGGLAAVRIELARQYPGLIAQVKMAPDSAPRALLGKTMIAAVCADDQENAVRIAARLVPTLPALKPLRLSPIATLAGYCRARGLVCEEALAPVRVELPAYTYTTEPALFASVPRAQYIPGWDYVIGEDGTILSDTGYMPLEQATRAFVTLGVQAVNGLIHYDPAAEEYIDAEVLFLSAPENSVGHWMVDFLPRLRGLGLLAGRKVKLAVPADLPARCTEMLRAFSGSPDDVIACAPGTRYRFRVCHIYRPGPSEPPNPVNVRFVRDGLLRGAIPKARPGKKVFLSRTGVGTRKIANAAEFQDFLAREGFVAADPADLSLADQKALLGDAEIILGPFGSNLFGMYLAPEGSTVMMLINAALEDPIFAPTAALLGLKHRSVPCAAAPEDAAKRPKDRDIIVDCRALARQLAEAGA